MIKTIDIKKEKLVDYIDAILTLFVFVSIIHYMFKQYEKYYMISYFLLPFTLKITSNLIERKENYNKKITQIINFIILIYLILMYILTMSSSAANNFFIMADKYLFPFFYFKEVKFSFWIVVCWMFLGMLKNKMLSLLLGIAVFIAWLLVYNLW